LAVTTIGLVALTSVFIEIAPLHDTSDVFGALPTVVMAVVGLVVTSKRPRQPIGWLLSSIAFLLVAQAFAQRYARYAYIGGHHLFAAKFAAWFGVWCWMPAFGMLGLLFMLFPTGRTLSPRWRWLAVAGIAFLAAIPFAALPALRDPGRLLLTAPSSAELPHGGALAVISQGPLLVLLGLGIVTLVVRWFRSRGAERQQMKWFLLGAAFLGASIVLLLVISNVQHTDDPTSTPIGIASQILGLGAVAVAVGVAVLRYRLYDIDRVITRTVTYAVVTLVLAGAYLLVALVPTVIVGSGHAPTGLVAAGTLAAAALFRPVRRRIQTLVDRRFNRSRYNAAQTIDAFAARLREQTDIETVGAELRAVVAQTIQPSHVSLWLRE
jgi:MFS family permease